MRLSDLNNFRTQQADDGRLSDFAQQSLTALLLAKQGGSFEGLRPNKTLKGIGWLGSLPMKDGRGRYATELTANSNVNGQDLHYPLIHPDISQKELDYLLSGGKPTDEMHDKAIRFALKRQAQGLSPYRD